jgi:pyridoxamine 5'-phosphate oxidase family protein
VRCLEIRGHAEAIADPADSAADISGSTIRIHPGRIISFGIDDPDHAPHELVAHNRDVAG